MDPRWSPGPRRPLSCSAAPKASGAGAGGRATAAVMLRPEQGDTLTIASRVVVAYGTRLAHDVTVGEEAGAIAATRVQLQGYEAK